MTSRREGSRIAEDGAQRNPGDAFQACISALEERIEPSWGSSVVDVIALLCWAVSDLPRTAGGVATKICITAPLSPEKPLTVPCSLFHSFTFSLFTHCAGNATTWIAPTGSVPVVEVIAESSLPAVVVSKI